MVSNGQDEGSICEEEECHYSASKQYTVVLWSNEVPKAAGRRFFPHQVGGIYILPIFDNRHGHANYEVAANITESKLDKVECRYLFLNSRI